MKLGDYGRYIVNRQTDIGYMLLDEKTNEEYFLHNNESNYTELKEGDVVRAFLYIDKQKRVAATLYQPFITINKGGLCEIVTVNQAGAYLNIGISKDILFSSDEYDNDTTPVLISGTKSKLPCKLRVRGNNLFIQLLTKKEMIEMNKGVSLNKNDEITGYVYRITNDGINIVDDNFNIAFIHRSNLRKSYHLGEEVKAVIIGVNENDYYASTILKKELLIKDDATRIIEYLKAHHGVMNYSSNTDPDIILRVFNMSKSAFKKALGNLYKEHKVILEEERTILIK